MNLSETTNQTSLQYQKQLYCVIKNLVDMRTQLISDTAIIANDAKPKEWPNIISKVKFIKNKNEKESDETLKIISELLKSLETPILKLENKLDLKNTFVEIIAEQSFKDNIITGTI